MLDFGDEFFLDEDKMESLIDLSSEANSGANRNVISTTETSSKTTKQITTTHPPTTSSNNLKSSTSNARPFSSSSNSVSSGAPPPPLLLDLNVDIIDDDGPFSLKSQQRETSPFRPGSGRVKRTPQPQSVISNEISELHGFTNNPPSDSFQNQNPQQEKCGERQGEEDDDDREVKQVLRAESPSNLERHEDMVQQQNAWLPIDLFQHDNL